MSWAEALAEALAHQKAGRLEQAGRIYLQVLEQDPENLDALHLTGMLALQRGDLCRAEACIRQALKRAPRVAMFHTSLGTVLRAAGRIEQAAGCYRRALELDPGNAHAALNLGMALQALERYSEAVAAYRAALASKPRWAEAHALLASALAASGRFSAAAEHCRRALQVQPDLAEAHNVLGVALEALGRAGEAQSCYEQALRLRPEFPEALNNRANLCVSQGRLEPAEADLRAALTLAPDYAVAWNNLGHVLETQGAVQEALACYRRAIRIRPGFVTAHSNLLLALHYDAETSPQEIFAEHRRWALTHAANFDCARAPQANRPDPARRLRIGYLSPDFRRHPVARFLEPVLACHDREAFELIAYSNTLREDAMTARLRSLVERWRSICELSDEEAAELIRRDRIDILVELAGHTARGRLLVVARRPAPIQVSWLGYPDTTGLEAVDYRLTDELADPRCDADARHTEELVRLPAPFLCFQPPREAPDPGLSPAALRGRIRFGAFQNLAKINRRVARAWAEILRAVPDSELLVQSKALGDPGVRRRLGAFLQGCAIPESRVLLRGPEPNLASHLAAYRDVDLVLDTFPYAGTTTTCEALWMGVPVVTLAGDRHAARTGLSLLSPLGLQELAPASVAGYVECAVRLASDPERLRDLRAGLRTRMAGSRLMDASGFTRLLEASYRWMWRRWCEGRRR